MIIKLEKEETIDGKIWYTVYVDDKSYGSFGEHCNDNAYEQAVKLYELIKTRTKEGFPKKIILKDIII